MKAEARIKSKSIINFAPTGMIPTREMTPHVPVSPEEIIEDVLSCLPLGVSMVHLHARDKNGIPIWRGDIYARIIEGIRKVDKDVVLCVSTSGRSWPEFEKRSECLELTGSAKPDMGSLTLSSLNFNKQASVNSPDMIQALAQRMQKNGIRPELEAFDIGMINYSKHLHSKGLLEPPFYFNLILGNIACAQANMLNLGIMVSELPEESTWSVGGVGDCQLRMNLMGLINGGGVRVGLEDNIFWDAERTRLATNYEQVERIALIAESAGIEVATSQEVRSMLCLEKKS